MANRSPFDESTDWVVIPYRKIKFWLSMAGLLVLGAGLFYGYSYLKGRMIAATQELTRKDTRDPRAARITEIVGDVRVKKVNSVNWTSAKQVVELNEGDMIQTDSGSSARIIFFDGTSYLVKPDSLVSIKDSYENRADTSRKVSVELGSGTVDLATSQKNVPTSTFEVETPNALASFEEFSEAQARYDNKLKESEFILHKGKAEITSRFPQPRRTELAALEAVQVDSISGFRDKTKLPNAPKLVSPKNLSTFATSDPASLTVKLSWEDVKGAKSYRLYVSPSPQFYNVRLNQVVNGRNFYELRRLDYGHYYWRVNAIDPRGVESPASETYSFTVAPKDVVARGQHEIDIRIEKVLSFGNSFEVIGRTTPGVMVFINDEIVSVKGDGSFKHFTQPMRQKGPSELVIVARDLSGANKTITYPVIVR